MLEKYRNIYTIHKHLYTFKPLIKLKQNFVQ